MSDPAHPPRSWHALSAQACLEACHTSGAGLDAQTVSERQRRFGLNRLPEARRQGLLLRALRQFHNTLIYVLLAASGLTLWLGHLVDSAVIFGVVLINAIVGVIQEGKAEQAMQAIRQMLAPRATVLRDGHRQSIGADQLVPGDMVLLDPGDRVAADLRLVRCHGLQVQEAILTGESLPVDKQADAVAEQAALGDRLSMAYAGTTVSRGQAQGLVVATGMHTELGRISGLLLTVETLSTPLIEQMDRFGRWLSAVILGIAALILVIGLKLLDYPFDELFLAVVGLSVAAIPEGLPAVLSITLAVGVQAMARRHAIVRRLPAIETLGSVSVICTDKTGTLTRNEMFVGTAVIATGSYAPQGQGYAPQGDIHGDAGAVRPQDHPQLIELAISALLCNDAELHQAGAEEWTVLGDPMEGALLAFAGKALGDLQAARAGWVRQDVLPFDARHKYMASLDQEDQGEARVSLKGAPEAIVALCGWQWDDDGTARTIDRDRWHAEADRIAARGQRVLALARSRPGAQMGDTLANGFSPEDLILLGLVGLVDPPREEAITAVAQCHEAGIRVKMITGDHAITAQAIAAQIGLRHTQQVLTGTDLDALDDAALRDCVLEVDVYARTSPEHKLRLVQALQAHDLVVAMTGDGVNDAPALKRADAGIAMGRKGSEAAKQASDLVLADDNFASIVAAVREGRTVYDNLRKVINWALPTSAGEAATIIAALLLGLSLPITPVQILWVNMITAVTLGLALAFEPGESGTMQRPPRARDEPLLDAVQLWQIVLVSGLFMLAVFGIFRFGLSQGYSLELARTLAMNTLVMLEIFYLFVMRKRHASVLTLEAMRGTRVVWIAIAVVALGQMAITYLPLMQDVFSTEPVGIRDGLLILGLGVALLLILETERQIRARL